MDSLGVGVIEIGCKSAPDRRQRRQEAPKRLPDDAGVSFVFFDGVLIGLGALGLPLFVPGQRCRQEVVKGKNHTCGSCPSRVLAL
jgi:hypothetical protein